MKRTIWIILAVIVVAALVTCPDEQAHKTMLKATITTALNEKIDQSCSEENLDAFASALGGALGGLAVDLLIDNRVYVENHFVCSIGYMTWDGETNIVSIGCFGHVFSPDKEDVLSALAERN
ncbi:MAG: hypothetical protein MJZ85_07185 [Bacteroidales bacterium]|nr:hypothetical protein [Bacteroidales bacterium]